VRSQKERDQSGRHKGKKKKKRLALGEERRKEKKDCSSQVRKEGRPRGDQRKEGAPGRGKGRGGRKTPPFYQKEGKGNKKGKKGRKKRGGDFQNQGGGGKGGKSVSPTFEGKEGAPKKKRGISF